MQLTSPAFTEGGAIPNEHAATRVPGGRDASIPLRWADVPEGTRSFALAMVDLHPIAHGWVHWAVADIPGDARALPAGASGGPAIGTATELTGTHGRPGYGGPQPPRGSGDHVYETTLHALDTPKLPLAPSMDLSDLREAMRGHVLGAAVLRGTFRG